MKDESVDGQRRGGKQQDQVSDVCAADRADHLKGPVARAVIYTFGDGGRRPAGGGITVGIRFGTEEKVL